MNSEHINPQVVVGKKYEIIETRQGNTDWSVGEVLTVKRSLGIDEFEVQESPSHSEYHGNIWCSVLYSFEEYMEESEKASNITPPEEVTAGKYKVVGAKAADVLEYWPLDSIVTLIRSIPDANFHDVWETLEKDPDGDNWILANAFELVRVEEEPAENNQPQVVTNFDEVDMRLKDLTPEVAQKILDGIDLKHSHMPKYKGKYMVTLFYTNGKSFRVNKVKEFSYSETTFSYTMKDFGSNSFIKEEVFHINEDQLAGWMAEDDNGYFEIKVLKPCFYEKHSIHIGKKG